MEQANHSNTERGIIPDFCQLPRVFMLVLLSELLAILFTILTFNLQQSAWYLLGLHSVFVLWISLFSGAFFCLTRRWLNRCSIVTVTVLSTAAIALITLLSSLLALSLFFNTTITLSPEQMWFLIRNTTAAVLITLVWMRYLYLRQQVLNGIIAEGEARFRSLQAKIQPHFLFNTLNTIASLIAISPTKAENTLEHLATLLRSSLKPGDDLVSLQTELDLCRHYLEIEQQRLGDKLIIEWQIDVDPEAYTLPPFTLQPLVENAVYHGIQLLVDGGVVSIKAEQVAGKSLSSQASSHAEPLLRLEVSNPLPASRSKPGNQTAQSNIQQRLSIRYGSQAKMITHHNNDHYITELLIPGAQS
ncbi:sensor histidine kinase [Pleionea mediterranea]|jgi:two-component system sensor histidine kinase AlgZ|uniref:Two-component system sensor histidine kinase AlgZ n=1 Tax=Pleionea mediterranea TaxID=523701 RepID=A0A316FZ19_9GAMM|nr:histidine kinase [Pleionea mediterranea]PWK52790.1 two-component system sensor histidine kinase AlgZ [Pleionea mediterranea]